MTDRFPRGLQLALKGVYFLVMVPLFPLILIGLMHERYFEVDR